MDVYDITLPVQVTRFGVVVNVASLHRERLEELVSSGFVSVIHPPPILEGAPLPQPVYYLTTNGAPFLDRSETAPGPPNAIAQPYLQFRSESAQLKLQVSRGQEQAIRVALQF